MHLTRPYEYWVRPDFNLEKNWQVFAIGERGVSTKAYNECGQCVNPLAVWNADQNALTMLMGFPPDSSKTDLLVQLIDAGAFDDGSTARFNARGCLNLDWSLGLGVRYGFCHHIILGAYLPAYGMSLKSVNWCDKTDPDNTAVRALLTDHLPSTVCELGCLDICGWKRAGIGDLMIMGEWLDDFPQDKPLLKNVRLNARLGLGLPTGLKQDENKIMAFPFGYDGATSILFAGGLKATIATFCSLGFDVQLIHAFGNCKVRRIKVQQDQTELLLLQKACAYKNWGLTQQFNIFAHIYPFVDGLEVKLDYQFIKLGESSLALATQAWSQNIANTAITLQENTAHTLIASIGYNHNRRDPDACYCPQVFFYAKMPCNGKQSVLCTTIGLTVGVDF